MTDILTQSQRDDIEECHEYRDFHMGAARRGRTTTYPFRGWGEEAHAHRAALLASEKALREQLERVRGLIDKWETDYHPVEPYDSAHTFIRDLEQALEQSDD